MSDVNFLAAPRPPGIGGAALTWIVCAVAGLVLNAAQLVLVLERLGTTARDVSIGLVVVLTVGAIAFYGLLFQVGVRLRKGWGGIQFPAWVVVLTATVLLLVNTGFGLDALLRIGTPVAQRDLVAWGVTYPCLMVVDVALVASSAVLLWQSVRYVDWVQARRGGRFGEAPPVRFPVGITIAGWTWTVLGLLAAGTGSLFVGYVLIHSGEFATWSLGLKLFLIAELYLVTLPLPCLFGTLLLNGRLPSTRAAGIGSLVVLLVVLCHALGGVWHVLYPPPFLRPSAELRNLHLAGHLAEAGMAFLAGIASIECIRGNAAYQMWLRARGFRLG
jgi:hypothetical protein